MAADLIQADYHVLQEMAARFGRESLATREFIRRLDQLAQALPAGEAPPALTAEILPALNRLANALADSQTASRQIIALLQQAEETAAHPAS
jgi:hypothetical protein